MAADEASAARKAFEKEEKEHRKAALAKKKASIEADKREQKLLLKQEAALQKERLASEKESVQSLVKMEKRGSFVLGGDPLAMEQLARDHRSGSVGRGAFVSRSSVRRPEGQPLAVEEIFAVAPELKGVFAADDLESLRFVFAACNPSTETGCVDLEEIKELEASRLYGEASLGKITGLLDAMKAESKKNVSFPKFAAAAAHVKPFPTSAFTALAAEVKGIKHINTATVQRTRGASEVRSALVVRPAARPGLERPSEPTAVPSNPEHNKEARKHHKNMTPEEKEKWLSELTPEEKEKRRQKKMKKKMEKEKAAADVKAAADAAATAKENEIVEKKLSREASLEVAPAPPQPTETTPPLPTEPSSTKSPSPQSPAAIEPKEELAAKDLEQKKERRGFFGLGRKRESQTNTESAPPAPPAAKLVPEPQPAEAPVDETALFTPTPSADESKPQGGSEPLPRGDRQGGEGVLSRGEGSLARHSKREDRKAMTKEEREEWKKTLTPEEKERRRLKKLQKKNQKEKELAAAAAGLLAGTAI